MSGEHSAFIAKPFYVGLLRLNPGHFFNVKIVFHIKSATHLQTLFTCVETIDEFHLNDGILHVLKTLNFNVPLHKLGRQFHNLFCTST